VTATRALFALQRMGITPGLERIAALLDRLGQPQSAFEAVLVAGTNGKGSTSAHLAAMLEAAGRSVGRFTSPHLTQPGERVVVNGIPLEPEAFEEAASRILAHAEWVGASFFEAVTALALRHFAERAVEVAVLEVGLGGRYDATNVVHPVASAITSISLDHQAILGTDEATIAGEKAGILRAGVPAWTSATGPALDRLRDHATAIDAPLRVLGRDHDAEVEARARGWRGSEVVVKRPGRPDLPFATPIVGAHQARNAALAALVALDLGGSYEAVATGAVRTSWPGRLERVEHPRGVVVLDGAHNPAAAAALASTLRTLGVRPVGVLGVSQEKDVAGILEALLPQLGGWYATRAVHSPRALDPERLAAVGASLGHPPAGVDPEPHRALAEAQQAASAAAGAAAPLTLIAGSLFLVGELRADLLGEDSVDLERWQ